MLPDDGKLEDHGEVEHRVGVLLGRSALVHIVSI